MAEWAAPQMGGLGAGVAGRCEVVGRLRPGTPVRVTAYVKDVDEQTGTYEAVLLVAGEVQQRCSVKVRANQAVRVKFTVRRKDAGTYTVRLGPLAVALTRGAQAWIC